MNGSWPNDRIHLVFQLAFLRVNIETDTFIFVIGVPRSGTTWLFDMIASHKDVASLNGSNTFLQMYVFPMENIYEREKHVFADSGFSRGLPSKYSKEEFEELIRDIIRSFYRRIPSNRRFYVEKATDLTSEVHKIRKYIPNSKFIHIIRDGRNCTVSRIKNRKKYGYPFGIEGVHEGAVTWKKQILEARSNSIEFSSDVLEVRYEDLLKDPVNNLRTIFNHVGLEADLESITEIARQHDYKTRPVSNPTSEVITPHGEPVQAYESEMTRTEIAYFEYLAGDLLEALGYPSKRFLDNKAILFYIRYVKIRGRIIKKEFLEIRKALSRVIYKILRIAKLLFAG